MFISNAYAQSTGMTAGGDLMGILPIVVMFVLLYFLMIRPQMKRTKEHKTMLEGLQKGDEVVAAGMLGKITKVGDAYTTVEIADGVVVSVQKQAVSQLLPKGTLKNV